MKKLFGICGCLIGGLLSAQSVGTIYHFDPGNKRCVDAQKNSGLNEDYLGECGRVERKDFFPPPGDTFDFSKRSFRGSNWNQMAIGFADFSLADFEGTRISESQLWGVHFIGANLVGVHAFNTQFVQVSFIGSDLQGAVFRRLNLSSTSFWGARLNFADLSGADLIGVVFNDADILKTRFDRADLSGAKFHGTKNSHTASFKGATYDRKTLLPFDSETARKKGMIDLDTD